VGWQQLSVRRIRDQAALSPISADDEDYGGEGFCGFDEDINFSNRPSLAASPADGVASGDENATREAEHENEGDEDEEVEDYDDEAGDWTDSKVIPEPAPVAYLGAVDGKVFYFLVIRRQGASVPDAAVLTHFEANDTIYCRGKHGEKAAGVDGGHVDTTPCLFTTYLRYELTQRRVDVAQTPPSVQRHKTGYVTLMDLNQGSVALVRPIGVRWKCYSCTAGKNPCHHVSVACKMYPTEASSNSQSNPRQVGFQDGEYHMALACRFVSQYRPLLRLYNTDGIPEMWAISRDERNRRMGGAWSCELLSTVPEGAGVVPYDCHAVKPHRRLPL
jgi:hypothetical protein